MHPAKSIVFFTTASGAGYGFMAALAGLLLATGGLWSPLANFAAFFIGLGLIVSGLLSSLLHLGRPERAWRALSQWRTSWLSREGCLALIFFAPAGVLGLIAVFAPRALGGPLAMIAALGVVALAAATVYSTAMIYASLRAIPAWYSPLVPPIYLAFAATTGLMLLGAFQAAIGDPLGRLPLAAAAAALVTGGLKLAYWRQLATAPAVATARGATGLGKPGAEVRLFEAPHTEANYIMKEMGFRIARANASALRMATVALAFVVPALAAFAAQAFGLPLLMVPAAVSCLVGAAIERTLFFAEAKHVVTLYYGATAV